MVAMEFHDMLFKLKKIDKGVLIWPSFFYYRDHKHKDTNTRCQLPITCIILLSTLCEGACVSVWVCVCVCVTARGGRYGANWSAVPIVGVI